MKIPPVTICCPACGDPVKVTVEVARVKLDDFAGTLQAELATHYTSHRCVDVD